MTGDGEWIRAEDLARGDSFDIGRLPGTEWLALSKTLGGDVVAECVGRNPGCGIDLRLNDVEVFGADESVLRLQRGFFEGDGGDEAGDNGLEDRLADVEERVTVLDDRLDTFVIETFPDCVEKLKRRFAAEPAGLRPLGGCAKDMTVEPEEGPRVRVLEEEGDSTVRVLVKEGDLTYIWPASTPVRAVSEMEEKDGT